MSYFEILTVVFSAVVSAAISILVYRYKARHEIALQVEKSRMNVLSKYREFICASAYELKGRIHNMLVRKLFFYLKKGDQAYADNVRFYSTYLFAQYFAWCEIFRKEVHYLRFAEGNEEVELLKLLEEIETAFASDKVVPGDKQFMIFKGEQRAIGECMITINKVTSTFECVGYSQFLSLLESKKSGRWLSILDRHMDKLISNRKEDGCAESKRLEKIHNLLVKLVITIDPEGNRFPKHREEI